MPFLCRQLMRKRLLPAIVFIFSRKGCEEAVQATSDSSSLLVSTDERIAIETRVAKFQQA
jgi:superfamily II RNA helicase